MALWFAGMALATVWLVFRDPALDYRLVVVGALLPDGVDAASGGRVMHTVLFSALLLAVVMLATRHRRNRRRHVLTVPIGTFLHLVFDGAWARTELFWWPLFGTSFGGESLPAVERGWADLPLELVGLAVLVWLWRRFRLAEPARRSLFLRTGRVGRDLVGEREAE